MLQKFIERPVLSTVISILLVLLGIVSLTKLPITQFPDIAPPAVLVTAAYPGASAEVVARSVATPLEEAINGVENMTYMTSNSNNDGTMTLSVFFKAGTDPDIASVNVQNRVAKANSLIPQEVLQAGLTTQKQQNSIIMAIALYSKDSTYDETFLQNYAKINIVPEIQRVHGVGQATIFGSKDYAMRIWLQPDRLAAYDLSAQDVLAAIKEQNLEAAPGKFGEGSKESFEYVIKYKGKLSNNEEYENIILKSNADGSTIKLKDVARVGLGSFNYTTTATVDKGESTGILIYQTAGSNANDILTEVNSIMERVKKDLPKGVNVFVPYSAKEFLDASIEKVKHTLLEAFILVFIVVFLFLQDFRSTLIPAIAVPVAILGTFFFMQLFGFTINLLTLFALILAIGIVVDDAIVVVEAVHTKMDAEHMSPRAATIKSMGEISGAIISITLVMAAVFVPVGFMQGPAGIFYKQFAFTLAIAILISAVNALTLSPALSALFLKNNHQNKDEKPAGIKKRFFTAFNAGFDNLTNRYTSSLRFLIKTKWIALTGLAIITVGTIVLVNKTPTGFIPTEDQSIFLYSLNMPAGASLERTKKVVEKVDSIIGTVEAVEKSYSVAGMNIITNATSPISALAFVKLKKPGTRGHTEDITQILGEVNQKLSVISAADLFTFTLPTVQGFGNTNGFELILQDRAGGKLDALSNTAYGLIGELMKRPEIMYAFTTFNTGNPQFKLNIDEARAKQLGVSISELLQTMQVYYGSYQASDFNRFGKQYKVILQSDIAYRIDPSTLNDVQVKSKSGQMIPIKSLVSLEKVYGPETVTRNNLFNAVTINGIPKPGYSSGEALKAVQEVAASYLPRGYAYEWSGLTREEQQAGSQTTWIFVMSLVFVYFLLAAQYESYILPLAVILSVPTGLLGVFAFINFAGIENNIYVQVGLIMLIGLLAKNAILIVEFAVQKRKAGMSIRKAAVEAARLRLRPILMTSFAFIAGLIPLLTATGASAMGNRSIGTGAVGGMLTGVVLGIFIIPVLFVIFQSLQERVTSKRVVEEEVNNEVLEYTS
ncbi:MAG: efflux RND transporter permease subunit [Ferruginibacter sp.]